VSNYRQQRIEATTRNSSFAHHFPFVHNCWGSSLRDRIAFGPKRKRWKRQICWWNDYDGFRRWAFALVGASLSNGETLITMFQSHQQKALRKAERMVKRMLLKGSYF